MIPSIQVTAILTAILIVVLTAISIRYLLKRKKGSVLIVGLSGCGKTMLFISIHKKYPLYTFTSLEPNICDYTVSRKSKLVNIIDLPGSERLKTRFFNVHKSNAILILFLIDATSLDKNKGDVSTFLVQVLNDEVVLKKCIPVVLGFNYRGKENFYDKNKLIDLLKNEIQQISETAKNELLSTNQENPLLKCIKRKKVDINPLIKITANSAEFLKTLENL